MVTPEIVGKFGKILELLEQKRGPLVLLGIFKMDSITDKWTIILSADWVTQEDYHAIYRDIRDISFAEINEKEKLQIARVGIFTPDNHLVEQILEKYDGEGHQIADEQINGNFIHEGYIIMANKLLADAYIENSQSDNSKQTKIV